ncbi:MAG: hypothetical protein ACRECO_21015 [Xanthobacteraceae bacterium]
MSFAKLYTWVVGGLFVVAVGFTLAMELLTKGVTLEAGHKALHVLIGFWAVAIVVGKRESQYRTFALTNGVLWGAVAIVGWTLPDFHGLDAFNRLDTILHTIVSVTGLLSVALTPRWRAA